MMHTFTPPMQLVHPNVTRECKEAAIYESLLKLDGAKVLELGCGKADHTRNIARSHPSAQIIAAEVDRVQLAKNLSAAPTGNISFADFGAQSIPLADASIDVVMMFRSLHHVPLDCLDTAMREIHRVLQSGGCAYISEPVFAGAYNELIRIYNDEELVRSAAFNAVCRAVDTGLLEFVSETFFLSPVHHRDFAEFAQKHFEVTHTARNVTDEQVAAVERLFNTHLGPDGVTLGQQVRVDLLRKPG
jgi:ubiquinone/menaquinone biosynthesis C-methylase UbiE